MKITERRKLACSPLSVTRIIRTFWFTKYILVTPMHYVTHWLTTWWRHQMETFSALLAICAGNSPVSGEFPAQRPVTRSFDVFFDLRLNKRLSKQPRCWWFETLSWSLWRHRNETIPLKSSCRGIVFHKMWKDSRCIYIYIYHYLYISHHLICTHMRFQKLHPIRRFPALWW